MYMDMYGPTAPLDFLPSMCQATPVRLVLGGPNDVMCVLLDSLYLTLANSSPIYAYLH